MLTIEPKISEHMSTKQNRVIVTTTINPPTEALLRFSEMKDWKLVVVMDKKTPQHSRLENAIYLSCEDQEKMFKPLSEAIGWNCIQRRNIGFAYAAWELNADIIASVDDDNIPLPGWGENLLLGKDTATHNWSTEEPVFDPVWAAGRKDLWHRGFPLQRLQGRKTCTPGKSIVKADIQADFWNGDPDIDAVCRMEHAPDVTFDDRAFPITSNKPSPFNSQNTFITREVLPHYFMFPEIGRMDDIWASYHVQTKGFRVVYGKATVVQVRNQHNPTRDLKHEWFGYTETDDLVKDLPNENAVLDRLPTRARRAFALYQELFK